MRSLVSRIERLEEIYGDPGQAGCVCHEHPFATVRVHHSWTELRMQEADRTAWFTCPVHGHRAPELLVRIVDFS